jgi:hypothetical protein
VDCLKSHSGLEARDEEPMFFEDLASAIKLRALFMIAFLMVLPDSSEVYLAQGSSFKMPII